MSHYVISVNRLALPSTPSFVFAEHLLQPGNGGEHGVAVVASFFRFSDALPPEALVVLFERRSCRVVGGEDLYLVRLLRLN